MEVHRQTCQSCGSREVRNILVRESNVPQTVYVRCARCGKLVARYRLSDYLHLGKSMESWLRSRGAVAADSGREYLEEFSRLEREAVEGYEAALAQLRRQGKDLE